MKTYIVSISILILAVMVILLLLFIGFKKEENAVLEFNITGGFWGRDDGFKLYPDGSVTYRVKKENVRTLTLPMQVLKELNSRVEQLRKSYPEGFKLEPSSGADYFMYSLDIYSCGEVISYRWTDFSEVPSELSYLADLLRGINSFLANPGGIIIYIKTSSLNISKGYALELHVFAFNPAPEDFIYNSPTPCHPDFKVLLYRDQTEPIELFPAGYDPNVLCIQVVQQRKLGVNENLHAEYKVTLNEKGTYIVEASFPYAEWSQKRFTSRVTVIVQD